MPASVRSRSNFDGAVANGVRGIAQLDKICWPATPNFVKHKSLKLWWKVDQLSRAILRMIGAGEGCWDGSESILCYKQLSEIGRKVKRRNGETELFISLWLLICEKCVALPTANARRWLTMTSMILMKCCVSRQLEGVSGKCSWRWVCEKTLGSDTLTPTLFVPNIHDCDIRIIGIPTYAIGSIVLDP